ncbi:MAG: hypothetical protein V4494_06695 [Chlamydiota bacterium]
MSEPARNFSVSRPIAIYAVVEGENRVRAGDLGANGKTFQLIVNFDNLSLIEKTTGILLNIDLVNRLPSDINQNEGKYSFDLHAENELEIFMRSLNLSPAQFKKLLQEKETQLQTLEDRHTFYEKRLSMFPDDFLIEWECVEIDWDEPRLESVREAEGGELGVYCVVVDNLSLEEKERNVLKNVTRIFQNDKNWEDELIAEFPINKIDISKKIEELEAKINKLKAEIG